MGVLGDRFFVRITTLTPLRKTNWEQEERLLLQKHHRRSQGIHGKQP